MTQDAHPPGWASHPPLPIPVYHQRHEPMFPNLGLPTQHQPYMQYAARQEFRRYPNPPYMPGAPIVPWPPRPEEQLRPSSRLIFPGPHPTNRLDLSREDTGRHVQPIRPGLDRPATPVSFIPDSRRHDCTWPDLIEANKTPTKASVQKARTAHTAKADMQRHGTSLHDPTTRDDAVIRKEAVAKLKASRSDSEYSDAPSTGYWRPGGSFQPSSSKQHQPQQLLTTNCLATPHEQGASLETSRQGSPMSRATSTSFGVESFSLTSLKSFGDGVWGNDDLPMLKARLRSEDRISPGSPCPVDRPKQTPAPTVLGVSADLPFTPLMDKLDLFGSPWTEFATPVSDLLLTPECIVMDSNQLKGEGINTREKEDWESATRRFIVGALCEEIRSELSALENSALEDTQPQVKIRSPVGTRPLKNVLNKLLKRFQGTDNEYVQPLHLLCLARDHAEAQPNDATWLLPSHIKLRTISVFKPFQHIEFEFGFRLCLINPP